MLEKQVETVPAIPAETTTTTTAKEPIFLSDVPDYFFGLHAAARGAPKYFCPTILPGQCRLSDAERVEMLRQLQDGIDFIFAIVDRVRREEANASAAAADAM